MNAQLLSMLKWIGLWTAFIFLIFFVINFLLKGLLFTLIKVKMSRGRLMVLRVYGKVNTYFRVGEEIGGDLTYKNRAKTVVHLKFPRGAHTHFLGVNWVDVDEETGTIVKPDFSLYPAFDPKLYDNLIVRALTRPSLLNNKLKIMLIIIIIVGILALVDTILLMQVYRIVKALPMPGAIIK